MPRILVPEEHRGWIARFGLDRWAKHKKFPRQAVYGLIDSFRDQWEARTGTFPDDGASAYLVAATLKAEGNLTDFIVGKGGATPTEMSQFSEILLAASWAVVQRYHAEVEAGKWPT